MKLIFTILTLAIIIILQQIFPSFFGQIYSWIFSNPSIALTVIIFAILGFIFIMGTLWRLIVGYGSSFGGSWRRKK